MANNDITVRQAQHNICTCGKHPGAGCECDSGLCTGGAAYIGIDGTLWTKLSPEPLTADEIRNHRRYAGFE